MLHHFTIETDREVDSAMLLDFMLSREASAFLLLGVIACRFGAFDCVECRGAALRLSNLWRFARNLVLGIRHQVMGD